MLQFAAGAMKAMADRQLLLKSPKHKLSVFQFPSIQFFCDRNGMDQADQVPSTVGTGTFEKSSKEDQEDHQETPGQGPPPGHPGHLQEPSGRRGGEPGNRHHQQITSTPGGQQDTPKALPLYWQIQDHGQHSFHQILARFRARRVYASFHEPAQFDIFEPVHTKLQ